MDLAISTHDQGKFMTYSYVFMSILLMLGIITMAALIVALGLTEDYYAVCGGLYIVYVVMSCCTDT